MFAVPSDDRGCSVGRRLAEAAAIALASIVTGGHCLAQVVIEPTIVETRVAPGGRVRLAFTVASAAQQSYEATTEIADLDIAPNGFPSAAPEPRERGASAWLTLKPASFQLRAGQSAKVEGEGRAPRGAIGTYSAMVTWKLSSSDHQGGAASRMRLNAVVMITVRGANAPKPQLAVDSIDVLPARESESSGRWRVRVPVSNKGAFHARVAGLVVFSRIGGGKAATVPVGSGRGYVLPGGTRELDGELPAPLRDGAYMALASVSAESTTDQVRRAGYFLVRNGQVTAKPPDEAALRALAALMPPITCDSDFVQMVVAPGGRRALTLQVSNHTSGPVTVGATVGPTDQSAANADTLPQSVPTERIASEWFAVSPDNARVEAGRARAFSITVTIPRDATGEHYAYLLFRPVGEKPECRPMAVLLAASAKGTTKQDGRIDGIVASRARGEPPVLSIAITNTGNAVASLDGFVFVLDEAGKEVGREYFSLPQVLMPSRSATAKVPWKSGLPRPKCRVRVSLRSTGTSIATKEATVVVPQ